MSSCALGPDPTARLFCFPGCLVGCGRLLSRRNLVQFYGACQTHGRAMLVLEYMEGAFPVPLGRQVTSDFQEPCTSCSLRLSADFSLTSILSLE